MVVSTQLKDIGQIGSSPHVLVKTKVAGNYNGDVYSSVFNSSYEQPPHAHATYIHGWPYVSMSISNPSACQLLKTRVAAL